MMLNLDQKAEAIRLFFSRTATAVLIIFLIVQTCFAQGHGPHHVEVVKAVEREIAPTVRLVGTLRPQKRTTVATEVSGRVAKLPVEDGDHVGKGDLLCKLRDAPRRFSYNEAVARMAELKADLDEQKAALRKAEFEKNRIERLWKLERSSEKEYTDTSADFEIAQHRVHQAMYAVDAQQAVVDQLADALGSTEIHAPFDGFVVTKHTEIGAWVDQGGDIIELVDLSTMRVRVNVPEAYVAFCESGAEAYVTVDAMEKSFAGRISRVIPDADQRARTFPVDIDIRNPDGRLKAGMFARASVPSGPKAKQILIPKDAVMMRGMGPMIFVVRESEKGQRAELMGIRVLSEVLDYVSIKAQGLSPGNWVVVRGNERMMGPGPVIAVPRHQAMAFQPHPDEGNRKSDGEDSEVFLSERSAQDPAHPETTTRPTEKDADSFHAIH